MPLYPKTEKPEIVAGQYKPAELIARQKILPALRAAARSLTIPLFSSPMTVENKGKQNFDPVTQADIGAEKAIRALIEKTFAQDGINGEEFADKNGISGWTWTIDPIDGTRGFVAGVPVWSTLIAISHMGLPVASMADFPALGQSFFGEPGHSWHEDKTGKTAINSRSCRKLSHAILGCTEPLSMFTQGELAAYNMIRSGIRFSRLGLDALGYCLLAMGRMDIIIEASLKPCDITPLIPIIEGAGGNITDWHGGDCKNGGRVVAVGDKALLPELYTYLGRAQNG